MKEKKAKSKLEKFKILFIATAVLGLIIFILIPKIVDYIFNKDLKESIEKSINKVEKVIRDSKEIEELTESPNNLIIDSYKIEFVKDTAQFSYGNKIIYFLELTNRSGEVIESASLNINISLNFNDSLYTLNSLNKNTNEYWRRHQPDEFTKISFERMENGIYNLKDYIEIDRFLLPEFNNFLDFENALLDFYHDSNTYQGESDPQITIQKIEKEYNTLWYPNETKKLKFTFHIRYLNNFESLPSIEYFKADFVKLNLILNATNTINFEFKDVILSTNITKEWNDLFYYETDVSINIETIIELFGLELNTDGWEIEEEFYHSNIYFGMLRLVKKDEPFTVRYHSIDLFNEFESLEEFSNFMNEKYMRKLKDQNTFLVSKSIRKVNYNNIPFLIEDFDATFNDQTYLLRIVNFKKGKYYFSVSYNKNENSQKYFESIKF